MKQWGFMRANQLGFVCTNQVIVAVVLMSEHCTSYREISSHKIGTVIEFISVETLLDWSWRFSAWKNESTGYFRLSIVQKYLQCWKNPPNKEAQLSADYNSSLPMGKILFPGRLYPRYNLLSSW